MRVEAFVEFIVARERHRIAKERGWSAAGGKPDPIISEYRFCNVRRNDDRVTKWIHEHVMEPLAEHDHLWFVLVICRLFNEPNTLGAFTLRQFVTFRPDEWRKKLKARREAGHRIFNAAYIVSTNGLSMDKIDYLIDVVLKPLWQAREFISPNVRERKSLDEVHKILTSAQGLGSFMAAQVIADLKYVARAKWKDFETFVASGPGSRRGLNRVLGGPLKHQLSEDLFREKLLDLRSQVNPILKGRGGMRHLFPLSAQDIQNCLCEFDKYERARLGEGRPKQKYTPHEEK